MQVNVLIIGAGASGLSCALTAAKRGKTVILIDHRQRAGDRIAIAGGGRCNFSNRRISPDDYACDNPRFLHSPLAAFPPDAAIRFLKGLGIDPVERDFGQLFCLQGGDALRNALFYACTQNGVICHLSTRVKALEQTNNRFIIQTDRNRIESTKLVLACGGLSYAKLGASDLGYRLAGQFGHRILAPSPGLVPLLFSEADRSRFPGLSGISLSVACQLGKKRFRGDLLFTHKGVSGPVILSASNHWSKGEEICIDWLPDIQTDVELKRWRSDNPRSRLRSNLGPLLPRRVMETLMSQEILNKALDQLSKAEVQTLVSAIHRSVVTPLRSDGYEKAEVTRGGIDTREIDNKTMESRLLSGLHIIGEVLDVTGNLGGYNLHWAWASGCLAGQSV